MTREWIGLIAFLSLWFIGVFGPDAWDIFIAKRRITKHGESEEDRADDRT